MIRTITEAAKHFCEHQMRSDFTLKEKISDIQVFIAYIDIDTDVEKKYRVYVASDKNFIQKVTTLFLEEENSDDETLMDMALETTNLIVGSAKVLAENSDTPYTINTPCFEKIGFFDFNCDQITSIVVGDDTLIVAIKDLNG